MSRFELPEGVPPSNERQDFSAPDMATPTFARGDGDARGHKTVREKREVYERVVEDEEDEENNDDGSDDPYPIHPPHGPNTLHVLIAIALLLLGLAAFVYMKNRQPTPLCSSQPEWNQYNCQPG